MPAILTPLSAFARRGATRFTPASVSGLIAWYRPGVGLFQDSAGTTPAVNDGDPVGLWKDQSGNGYDLQASGAGRPTLKLNVQNGLPTVRFTTSNTMALSGNFASSYPQPYSIFGVLSQTGAAAGTGFFLARGPASVGPLIGLSTGSGVNMIMGCWATGGTATLVGGIDGNLHIFGADWNGASSVARVDAQTYATTSVSPGTDHLVSFGLNEGNVSFRESGDAGEIAIYTTPPSSTQKTQLIDGYLNGEWKIFTISNPPVFDTLANYPSATWDHEKLGFRIIQGISGTNDWRMWYGCGGGLSDPNFIGNAYATSTDGVNWTKPNLGQQTYGGNTNNNLLTPGSYAGGFGGWVDYYASAVSGQQFVMGLSIINGSTGGLFVVGSSDGITWTSLKTVYNTASPFKEGKVIVYDPTNGKLTYFYTFGHGSDLRSVGRFTADTTDATSTWTDQGGCTGLQASVSTAQFYTLDITIIGSTWYAGVDRYNSTTGVVYSELWSSTDKGATWTALRQPWIPLGSLGNWDSTVIFGTCVVPLPGGGYRSYYSAGNQVHSVAVRNEQIGIASVPFP